MRRQPEHVLTVAAILFLVVVGLIAVGLQLMNAEGEAALVARPELAGIIIQLQQVRGPRPVGFRHPDVLGGRHLFRLQVDRTAEIGGAHRGSRTGAAVEIDAADPLDRKIRPAMLRDAVGVLERNAVEGHRVIAVWEAAEKSLALAEPSSVGAEGIRSRCVIDVFAKVGDGRFKVPDEVATDFRFCRYCVKHVPGRRELRGQRDGLIHRHRLIHARQAQRDRQVFCAAPGYIDVRTARRGKARRHNFDGVFAGWQSVSRKTAVLASPHLADHAARLAFQRHSRTRDYLPYLVEDGTGNRRLSCTGLREQQPHEQRKHYGYSEKLHLLHLL